LLTEASAELVAESAIAENAKGEDDAVGAAKTIKQKSISFALCKLMLRVLVQAESVDAKSEANDVGTAKTKPLKPVPGPLRVREGKWVVVTVAVEPAVGRATVYLDGCLSVSMPVRMCMVVPVDACIDHVCSIAIIGNL
jgi:hypothetical protein